MRDSKELQRTDIHVTGDGEEAWSNIRSFGVTPMDSGYMVAMMSGGYVQLADIFYDDLDKNDFEGGDIFWPKLDGNGGLFDISYVSVASVIATPPDGETNVLPRKLVLALTHENLSQAEIHEGYIPVKHNFFTLPRFDHTFTVARTFNSHFALHIDAAGVVQGMFTSGPSIGERWSRNSAGGWDFGEELRFEGVELKDCLGCAPSAVYFQDGSAQSTGNRVGSFSESKVPISRSIYVTNTDGDFRGLKKAYG